MADWNIPLWWRLWVDHTPVTMMLTLHELDALFDEGVIDECTGLSEPV